MENSTYQPWFKKSKSKCILLISFLLLTFSRVSDASSTSSSNLPFTTALGTLQQAITGPVLLSASIIMVVITCLMLAFGSWGEGFSKFINIVMWLSVAFTAVATVTALFGSGAVC